MNDFAKRALLRADPMPNDEIGFKAVETPDGMVSKIWYRTVGDQNVLYKYEEITLEKWEWEKHGITNARDWRVYLEKCFWGAL